MNTLFGLFCIEGTTTHWRQIGHGLNLNASLLNTPLSMLLCGTEEWVYVNTAEGTSTVHSAEPMWGPSDPTQWTWERVRRHYQSPSGRPPTHTAITAVPVSALWEQGDTCRSTIWWNNWFVPKNDISDYDGNMSVFLNTWGHNRVKWMRRPLVVE